MAKLIEGPKMSGTIGGINYYMLDNQCVARTPKDFNKRKYKEEGRYRGFKRSGQCHGAASKMLSKEVYRLLPKEEQLHGVFGEMCGRANVLQRKQGKSLEEVKDIIMMEYRIGKFEVLREKGSNEPKMSKGSKKEVGCERKAVRSVEQGFVEGLERKVEQLEAMVRELITKLELMMKVAVVEETLMKVKELHVEGSLAEPEEYNEKIIKGRITKKNNKEGKRLAKLTLPVNSKTKNKNSNHSKGQEKQCSASKTIAINKTTFNSSDRLPENKLGMFIYKSGHLFEPT